MLTFTLGVTLAVTTFLSVGIIGVNRVAAAGVDCDNNAFIKCGYSSPSDFIAKVKANNSLNGHNDLQAAYKGFGLSSTDYSNFQSHAVAGEVDRNGNIVVGGRVVATDAMTFGRIASYHGSGYVTKTISGQHYYGNTADKTFASGVTSLPIYALLDSNGNLQFAAIKSCGNPAVGNNVSCKMLNMTAVAGKTNTYSFTATANARGSAKVTKYVYDFGDGSNATMTNGSTPVTHAYTKAGTFTASVTEYASVPGNSNFKLTVISDCKKVVTVKLPFYSCVQLTGAILDKSKMSYSFTAAATFGNGATFTSADFDFGDGKHQNGVSPNGTVVTATHTYAAAGKYNASAVLHFSLNGKDVTAKACPALVTPETVTPECKPGVPLGSPECTPPCQPGSSVPPESPECVPPSLPNTGAGNTIAIFAAVVVGGFLIYRQLIFRKHKAAFLAAERGTSPLPLQDPLEELKPVVHAKRTLRRKRQF